MSAPHTPWRHVAATLALLLLVGAASACFNDPLIGTRCDDAHLCGNGLSCIEGRCLEPAGGPETDAGALEDAGPRDDAGFPDDAGFLDAGTDAGVEFPPDCSAHTFGGHSYLACTNPVAAAAGATRCTQLGMVLATVNDEAEQIFLLASTTTDSWIGLSDAQDEGVFVWTDGSAPLFNAFGVGQPDDYGAGEDCVHLRKNVADWNDNDCSVALGIVCEEPDPQPVSDAYCFDAPQACPCTLRSFGGAVFAFCDGARSHAAAASTCDALGMQLADPRADEVGFVAAEAASRGLDVWFGLDDIDNDGTFTFADDTEPVGPPWAAGSPVGGSCAFVRGTDGDWGSAPCTEARAFSCVTRTLEPPPADCAAFSSSGHDYLSCTNARSFDEGRSVCLRAGMDLVVVDDSAEDALVASQTPAANRWVGWTDRGSQGAGRTVAGALPTFTAFVSGQPDGLDGDCALQDTTLGGWRDAPCADLARFVCEETVTPPAPPAAPVCATSPLACPGEHTMRGGVLTVVVPNAATFAEATAACAGWGMVIAQPKTASDNLLLRQRVASQTAQRTTWIGLTDAAVEGTFRFVDGTALSYDFFAGGEPNNAGEQDCAAWWVDRGLRWDDLQCTARVPFICQAAAPPEPGCTDADGDGFGAGCDRGLDCNDANANMNPALLDVCDLLDNDCSGVADDDADACGCSRTVRNADEYWLCGQGRTQAAARVHCALSATDLAVITAGQENNFVINALDGAGLAAATIGADDLVTEGSFRWVDGSTSNFDDFGPGEPSGGADEDCVEISTPDAFWRDVGCGTSLPFVCEN